MRASLCVGEKNLLCFIREGFTSSPRGSCSPERHAVWLCSGQHEDALARQADITTEWSGREVTFPAVTRLACASRAPE